MADRDKKSTPFLMRFQPVEGISIALIIFYFGYYRLPPLVPLPESGDFSNKLLHVIYCSIVPGLTFFFAIVGVLRKRHQLEIVNPLSGHENLLQLEHNFAQNTLEQLTVYLVSTAILSTYLEGQDLKLISLNALVFTVGRILFRIGYGVHPKYRGIGVWCFFTGQAIILGLCIYFLYTHGLMHGLELADDTERTQPPLAKQEL